MFHFQVLKNAAELEGMNPNGFCKEVGGSEDFATAFTKMMALARLMKEQGASPSRPSTRMKPTPRRWLSPRRPGLLRPAGIRFWDVLTDNGSAYRFRPFPHAVLGHLRGGSVITRRTAASGSSPAVEPSARPASVVVAGMDCAALICVTSR